MSLHSRLRTKQQPILSSNVMAAPGVSDAVVGQEVPTLQTQCMTVVVNHTEFFTNLFELPLPSAIIEDLQDHWSDIYCPMRYVYGRFGHRRSPDLPLNPDVVSPQDYLDYWHPIFDAHILNREYYMEYFGFNVDSDDGEIMALDLCVNCRLLARFSSDRYIHYTTTIIRPIPIYGVFGERLLRSNYCSHCRQVPLVVFRDQ